MQSDRTRSEVTAALSTLSPELETVLLTARGSLDDSARRRLQELVIAGLDWDRVIEIAVSNQVLPLVAAGLLSHHGRDLPTATAAYLADFGRGLAARNMQLTAELFGVLDAFAKAGVAAFPYKGPALAVIAYGSVRFRQFGDLDLLVRKDHYLDAMRALQQLGFAPLDGGPSGGRRYLSHRSAHAFARDNVHIDLQWGSTYRKALSIPIDESLWDSTEEVELLGRTVRSIPSDILFVFLCAHGARHQWDRLKWVCDVAEMVRTHPDLSWGRILQRAKAAGAERVVHMALLLADSLVDAPIPPAVLDAAKADTQAAELCAVALEHHLIGETAPLTGGKAQMRFTMGTKERARDRVRFVAGLFFEPTEEDYAWIRLPDRAWQLYRVLRPLRLAGSVLRSGVGAVVASDEHHH